MAFPQLQRQDFSNALSEILKSTGFSSENLKLELTERYKLVDENTIKTMLEDFRKLGKKVCIEGIENKHMARMVKTIFAVDNFQGYF